MADPRPPVKGFQWHDLGNITTGRPNLGDATSVRAYRLMQFTLRYVLTRRYGTETAGEIFAEAGKAAGAAFCHNILDRGVDFPAFLANLQLKLRELHIGIMRVEKADIETMSLTLTISEDLDCSGLAVSSETVCDYDEGFIAGILGAYTGKDFVVREIDCWASGGRTCRFEVHLAEASK